MKYLCNLNTESSKPFCHICHGSEGTPSPDCPCPALPAQPRTPCQPPGAVGNPGSRQCHSRAVLQLPTALSCLAMDPAEPGSSTSLDSSPATPREVPRGRGWCPLAALLLAARPFPELLRDKLPHHQPPRHADSM